MRTSNPVLSENFFGKYTHERDRADATQMTVQGTIN